jgi:hypothetical protein
MVFYNGVGCGDGCHCADVGTWRSSSGNCCWACGCKGPDQPKRHKSLDRWAPPPAFPAESVSLGDALFDILADYRDSIVRRVRR